MDIRVRLDPATNQWIATAGDLPGVEIRGMTAQDAVTNAANLIGRLQAADAVVLPMATAMEGSPPGPPPVMPYRPAGAAPPVPLPSPPEVVVRPPLPPPHDEITGGLLPALLIIVSAIATLTFFVGLIIYANRK